MDARERSARLASTYSPLGVLSAVNGCPKRKLGRPSGRACCFVFGYRLGPVVLPWGPPPRSGPAVHSNGSTALHYAALYGNRRIVRLLVDANADVNAQNDSGCAVSACGESADECAGRVLAAVGRAGGRRCTGPRTMAIPHPSRSCCCAAPTGPSRTTSTGTYMLHRAFFASPAHSCSQLPRPTLCSVLRCLFVCFFVCLFVRLRLAFANHTVDDAVYAAHASSRGDGLFAACCAGVRCACTGALPPTPPSRCRTKALRQCVCYYA